MVPRDVTAALSFRGAQAKNAAMLSVVPAQIVIVGGKPSNAATSLEMTDNAWPTGATSGNKSVRPPAALAHEGHMPTFRSKPVLSAFCDQSNRPAP